MEYYLIYFVIYASIATVHFGFHVSMFHTSKMLEERIRNSRSRREPVYDYHRKHFKLSPVWPLSVCIQVRDILMSDKGEKKP